MRSVVGRNLVDYMKWNFWHK